MNDPSRPEPRDYLTIFLVSAAVMLYQITLTRVLSVVVWYHFAFLTISMVMLGLGAPGVWFAFARNPQRTLPAFLLASGIAVPLSIAVLVEYGTLMLGSSILAIIACVLPVTLSLGGVVCLVLIKASGRHITRMYGVDLLGAGLASVLVIPLMHLVPTPHFAAASGLLPLLSLMQYGRRWRVVGGALALLLVGALFQGDAFRVTRSKGYDETAVPPVYEKWSPTARITVFDESFFYLQPHGAGFSWGRGRKFPKDREIQQYWLEQDGSAGTPITRFDGDLTEVEHLLYDVTTVGYQVRPPETVAIIGAGGGRDILSALLAAASDVDAIELNEYTIDAVSNRFGELSGDVYHAPGVHAIASEGRSYLTHSEKSYDLIQISLIDSWAASAAGAFALAENNLYTVEAFELYAERLRSGGVVSTSRWLTEMPRLIVLAHAALRSIGVEDPRRHMMIASARSVGTLLVTKDEVQEQDLRRLDDVCAQRGFVRLYPVPPGEEPPNAFIADTVDDDLAAMADLGLNVEAPTDDSPYFFHLVSPFTDPSELAEEARKATGLPVNVNSTRVLRQAMFGVAILALLLFLLPFLARVNARQRREPFGHLLRGTLYFAAIGCAFMLMENVLVQRFVLYLGHPSYALTVIVASLLIGMGVGSISSERLGVARLKRGGLLVPLALALLVVGLPPLFAGTLGTPLVLRIAISAALLVPLGGVLGLFFPLGMLCFGDRAKPWYWAINGAFGVVASVMSLALSMDFGFTTVGFLAALGYVVAWACIAGQPTATERVP
jgi:hypothetical protein